jgi:eukaryotic-like serine/threonine-protein kinase
MANPDPGTTIGSYQIEDTIGAGSMGDVFRGIDVNLNRKVAIKILSEKHRESPELRARFVREGRAVAAIQHANVVQVFTTGTFDERPFIAMEFLDGTDLGSIVEDHGPLSSYTAAKMILDAARGLQAAAQAGLIHRDVKPSNLVRLNDGRVKVTDFGLAKPVDPGSEPALTALGVVVGTPDYIAPEQARGDAIDERVDIYALGGTLYYLLIAMPPFRTGKPGEDKYLKVVARHLRQPPPDPRAARPEVDDALAELTRAMMAKKPADRPDYQTLIARLDAIVTRLGALGGADAVPQARSSGSSSLVAKTPFVGGEIPHGFRDDDAPGSGKAAGDAAAAAPGRRLPVWVVVVTILSVLVLGAGVAVYLTRDRAASPGDPPRPGEAATPTLDGSAAIPVDAAPPAPPAPPDPIAPDGMALVKRPDGTPWFFADKVPVRHGDYARVFPKEKKPSAKLDGKPVTHCAYNLARAYAQAVTKRLLTSDEYDAALATPGVEAAPAGMWEWVQADGAGGTKEVRAPGRSRTRKPQTAQPDVTFRLARDLSP